LIAGAILIYHKDRDSFILVEQFRPAVYMKNKNGITVELCAGIIDKDLSLEEIAKEERGEECGYMVLASDMQGITSVNSAVGVCWVQKPRNSNFNGWEGFELEGRPFPWLR